MNFILDRIQPRTSNEGPEMEWKYSFRNVDAKVGRYTPAALSPGKRPSAVFT